MSGKKKALKKGCSSVDQLIIKDFIRNKDFENQDAADYFYQTQTAQGKPIPYIFFTKNSDQEIDTVSLQFGFGYDHGHFNFAKLKYKPFQLFQPSFWLDHGINPFHKVRRSSDEKNAELIPLDPFIYNAKSRSVFPYGDIEARIEARKKLARTEYGYRYRFVFTDGIMVACARNIWKKYGDAEGYTTITKGDFRLWLYRLNVLVYDLLEHPYQMDDDWKNRENIIKVLVQDLYGESYEVHKKATWGKYFNGSIQSARKAYEYRVADAKDILNKFKETFMGSNDSNSEADNLSDDMDSDQKNKREGKDALKRFLIELYESFGNEMVRKEQLSICEWHKCERYIVFKQGKNYCTLAVDGRDCGDKARAHRNYLAHHKKIRTRNKLRIQEARREAKLAKAEKSKRAALLKLARAPRKISL